MLVKEFLTGLRRHINEKPLRFVTGNQSADMDSVVSALSFAFFKAQQAPSEPVVPIINITREEFKLRKDIGLLLGTYSIGQDLLFFIEDFERMSENCEKVHLTLVDHCNIQGDIFHKYAGENKLQIDTIIDHHEDENVAKDADPRIITKSGSCSSLVFNYFYTNLQDKTIFDTSDVCGLLLGPLLIDTSNMTQKVEMEDSVAFSRYIMLLQDSHISKNMTRLTRAAGDVSTESLMLTYYETLKSAKKDLSGLSFFDILRKDYKQFTFNGLRVGFSSLGKLYLWIFNKFSSKDIEEALLRTVNYHNLDMLVITTSYTKKTNNEYTREFSYYVKLDAPKAGELKEIGALARQGLSLNDKIYDHGSFEKKLQSIDNLILFNQGNVQASRKQVVPIIKDVLETKF
jgi:exopolyphosphatase